MRIYVASSWKNDLFDEIVKRLKRGGHEVYDFKENGFNWKEIQPDYETNPLTPKETIEMYGSFKCSHAFVQDMTSLSRADMVILVQPCGRSAHLELGYAIGCNHKHTIALIRDGERPDIMYKMVDHLVTSIDELIEKVHTIEEVGE